ncbi:MAG: restriction endonuclease subunit S [Veillonella sp.]|nr:restriction endonuclease subunit S [Veillonella sp.]
MRNKPRIRFKGFTEDWEQRKLTDIAKTFIGLVTTMTENYRDSGTLLIRNSDIKEGQFIFSEKPIHLDEEFAEKNKTRRLQIGDVVTVHTGDIGTSAVIKEKEAGAIGFATINTRTDKRILNPYFLSTYFNTDKHKCYANSVSTGDGRSNYNIKDFNKLVISIPTLDEQEKISALINNINTIITLHQGKLEKLKLTKKAMLQKLFPKNGSQFPGVRFKTFCDSWKPYKLGHYFKKYQNVIYLEDDVVYKQISVRNNGVIEYRCSTKGKDIGRKRQYIIDTMLYPDTLTFTRQTVYEGGIGFVPKTLDGAIVTENMPLLAMRNSNKDFMMALFNSQSYISGVLNKNALSGSAQKALHERDWLNSVLLFPDIEEQKLIGRLINIIDKYIDLHYRKLDKLYGVKKSLLQKMFV